VTTRRFPPPWSAEVQPNYYVVRDADGQQIAYVYYSGLPRILQSYRSLAKRLGEEFGLVFITPPVLCGDELLLVVPPPPAPAPIEPPQP
jgi:hypothetical protein